MLDDNENSLTELMNLASIKHRPTFLKNYIYSLIENGLLNRKFFNNNHPKQKYILTEAGKKYLKNE